MVYVEWVVHTRLECGCVDVNRPGPWWRRSGERRCHSLASPCPEAAVASGRPLQYAGGSIRRSASRHHRRSADKSCPITTWLRYHRHAHALTHGHVHTVCRGVSHIPHLRHDALGHAHTVCRGVSHTFAMTPSPPRSPELPALDARERGSSLSRRGLPHPTPRDTQSLL